MEFLCFVIEKVQLKLPERKIKLLKRLVHHMRVTQEVTLRELARVVGLLSSLIQDAFPGLLLQGSLVLEDLRSVKRLLVWGHSERDGR